MCTFSNHSDINAVDKLMETSDEDYAVYMNSSSADVHRKIEQLKRAPVVPRGVETTDSPEASNGSQEASDEVVRQLVSPQEGAGQESDNSDPCVEDEVHVGFGDDEVVKSKPLLPGLMEDGSLSNEESDSSDGEVHIRTYVQCISTCMYVEYRPCIHIWDECDAVSQFYTCVW